ncbi:MAG: hypothetical protein DRP76_03040 [Candidatus Omnitrophota bacterium]|nr:MAG: hypothetical protein DRP76_03040 [Candidatus Omnitrophota bacterium]
MKVSPFLKEERIILELKAKTKEEAIKEVASLLKDASEIINLDDFLKEVFEREKIGSTGIGKGIAIPHARTDNVKKFVIAIGKSEKGIEFQAVDKRPVKIIFLMGTPKEEGLDEYLKILAHLMRLIDKEAFRSSLFSAKTAKEIIEIFKSAEE